MRFLLCLCLFFFFVAFPQHTSSFPASDEITNLPGLNQTLSFKQYAGYLDIREGRKMFYWLVLSQKQPSTDPLVLWLTGGPGCSSLSALLAENGPFYPDQNGNLIANPYSWNKVVNMLFLESPAGVGFSILPNPIQFNDNMTAEDNYEALGVFFKKFPSLEPNSFYISGESYAGHYIPTLAWLILNQNRFPINFIGFLVGNPSTTPEDDDLLLQYLKSHALIAPDSDQVDFIGNYDPYDVLVDTCPSLFLQKIVRFPSQMIERYRESTRKHVPEPPACIDSWTTSYLNIKDVKKAIHAHENIYWEICGGPDYDFGRDSIVPYYEDMMNNSPIQILVYSGDADTVVNIFGTESWIYNMNRPLVKKWSPWNYQRIGGTKQLGGYSVQFDRITFATVKGAGHMVPWFQPAPALEMLTLFLKGKL